MAYLERSYRRTNVYTDYHRQLENLTTITALMQNIYHRHPAMKLIIQ